MEKEGREFSSVSQKNKQKSSLKSSQSKGVSMMKGKNDSSEKPKRGRKVQFNSEGSPGADIGSLSGSDAHLESPSAEGGLSMGDKNANSKKISAAKESQPLELKIEQELPKKAKFLMDCEAAQILQGIREEMVVLSQDPTIKIPLSFDKGLQYARTTTSRYTNPLSVRQLLQDLAVHGVSDSEICMIGNVCPETIDEAFALVPSLKSKKGILGIPLNDVLCDLTKLKQQQL